MASDPGALRLMSRARRTTGGPLRSIGVSQLPQLEDMMAGPPITQFEPDPERLRPLTHCMALDSGSDPEGDWPYNILSRKTVVYGDGKIARAGEPVTHRVDPDELALCRRLAEEAV